VFNSCGPLEAVMGTFTDLRTAIGEYVNQAKATGAVIDINQGAIRLATKYPQTGLTIDEIANEIARAAALHGVPLFSAGHSSLAQPVSKASD
jgi:hypothetical protein